MDRFLHYIIFFLFLMPAKHQAQLYPINTPGAMETAVSNTSKAPVHKALKRCTGFSIFSDTKEIVFQKPGAIGILIAPAKKNKVVSFTCNAASADYPGRIYACWDDEKFNPGNSDIFLAYTDDNGDTWTEPILVTYRPNHKTQVMPQVATDKKGYVYIIYYDGQILYI